MKVTAHFTAQAWVGNNAIAIDPAGPVAWDATPFFNELPLDYRNDLTAQMCCPGDVTLDYHDAFKHDPAAPEWVRRHSGPFDVHLERTDA